MNLQEAVEIVFARLERVKGQEREALRRVLAAAADTNLYTVANGVGLKDEVVQRLTKVPLDEIESADLELKQMLMEMLDLG